MHTWDLASESAFERYRVSVVRDFTNVIPTNPAIAGNGAMCDKVTIFLSVAIAQTCKMYELFWLLIAPSIYHFCLKLLAGGGQPPPPLPPLEHTALYNEYLLVYMTTIAASFGGLVVRAYTPNFGGCEFNPRPSHTMPMTMQKWHCVTSR